MQTLGEFADCGKKEERKSKRVSKGESNVVQSVNKTGDSSTLYFDANSGMGAIGGGLVNLDEINKMAQEKRELGQLKKQ